ncbi:hypothetical protein CR513_11771, partial [Mucuna pruriens]
MVNATNRQALMDKTYIATRKLISNMAENSQHIISIALTSSKGVNEVTIVANNQSWPLDGTSKSRQQISAHVEYVAYAPLKNLLSMHDLFSKE